MTVYNGKPLLDFSNLFAHSFAADAVQTPIANWLAVTPSDTDLPLNHSFLRQPSFKVPTIFEPHHEIVHQMSLAGGSDKISDPAMLPHRHFEVWDESYWTEQGPWIPGDELDAQRVSRYRNDFQRFEKLVQSMGLTESDMIEITKILDNRATQAKDPKRLARAMVHNLNSLASDLDTIGTEKEFIKSCFMHLVSLGAYDRPNYVREFLRVPAHRRVSPEFQIIMLPYLLGETHLTFDGYNKIIRMVFALDLDEEQKVALIVNSYRQSRDGLTILSELLRYDSATVKWMEFAKSQWDVFDKAEILTTVLAKTGNDYPHARKALNDLLWSFHQSGFSAEQKIELLKSCVKFCQEKILASLVALKDLIDLIKVADLSRDVCANLIKDHFESDGDKAWLKIKDHAKFQLLVARKS